MVIQLLRKNGLVLFSIFAVLIATFLILSQGCSPKTQKPTLWVYTSLYPDVIQEYSKQLEAKFPEIEVKWYQAGSENVAAKLNAEILAEKPQADIIMTSDTFWCEELKSKNHLLAYKSALAEKIPAQFKDPDSFYVTARIPVMVIAYNKDVYSEAEAPHSFKDLALDKYKNKIAMPNPLESGTTFTTVALLSKKLGWDFFKKLRENEVMVAGGNSAVFARIESKERPIGMVLLENVLAAKLKGLPIEAVYPKDGVSMIPSPIAILASSKNPELAKKVYDYFLSEDGQKTIVEKGEMHGIQSSAPAPHGAVSFQEIQKNHLGWNRDLLLEILKTKDQIKSQFSSIMM